MSMRTQTSEGSDTLKICAMQVPVNDISRLTVYVVLQYIYCSPIYSRYHTNEMTVATVLVKPKTYNCIQNFSEGGALTSENEKCFLAVAVLTTYKHKTMGFNFNSN